MPKEIKVVSWRTTVFHHRKGEDRGLFEDVDIPDWFVSTGLEDAWIDYHHLCWCRKEKKDPAEWEWKASLTFTAITEEDLNVW